MTKPDFYTEGSASSRTDTMARVLKKRLGLRQEQVGGDSANNPARNDTKAMTRRKLNKSLST